VVVPVPVPRNYRTLDSRRLFTYGEDRWHTPAPEGEFTYVEFTIDEIAHNTSVGQPGGILNGRPDSSRLALT